MVCGCTPLIYKSIDSNIIEHEHYCIDCKKLYGFINRNDCIDCQKMGNCNFKEG